MSLIKKLKKSKEKKRIGTIIKPKTRNQKNRKRQKTRVFGMFVKK